MDRKITALKVQKRNSNRVNVYLDGEFAFGVSRIVSAWLQIGQTLTEEKILSLQKEDTEEVAFQNALKLLSFRPRSIHEVQKKLKENGFDESAIHSVIERLTRDGLVEDGSFAQAWVENRTVFHPRSRKLIALELRQKGVPDEVVQNALAAGSVDDETLAYQSAIQYSRRLKGLEWLEFRKKLSAYLLRRGFSYETVSPMVRRVWDELQQSAGDEAHTFGEDE
jgi:regulatory protein